MVPWGCPRSQWCHNPQGPHHGAGLRTGLFPMGLLVEYGTLGTGPGWLVASLFSLSVTGNASLLLLPLNDPEKLSCKAADPHTGRQVV